MEVLSLHAKPVDLRKITDADAQSLLRMLDAARDMETIIPNPRVVLGNYSVGVAFGRPGRYTAFYMGSASEVVAMTHTTDVGTSSVELDALARMPNKRGLQLGAQVLNYTLARAKAAGKERVGLYTPPRNIEFYQTHGFSIDEEVEAEGLTVNYTRMFAQL